ncbi:MAG: FAD-binding protein [Anaerolineaceae bacterium]|nr:FAD-binding protein [Anaerolineaceae bacterium]
MTAHQDIWTFSEKSALGSELIAGARSLAAHSGGMVAAIVLGAKSEAERAIAAGADKVYWLGEQAGSTMVEDYVPSIASVVQSEKPFGLLIGATKRGKAVAGRLGAALGASVITDVKSFVPQGQELQATHMVFGGGAIRIETHTSEVMLATVGSSMFEALTLDPARKGEIVEVKFVEPKWRLTLRERKVKPPSSVNLAAAKKVVCPGRGVSKQEDLAMIQDLAKVLEAEVGCTRPLAEGLDWLPRERYIGVSGAFIKPDLYLGVGVSGQVQHTVGITDSRVVVAINKDKNAPIFAQADYGIVGDLYAIIPALITVLKNRK